MGPRAGVTQVTWQDRGQLPPIVGGLFRDLFQKRLREHMRTGLERLHDLVGPGGSTDLSVPSAGPPPPVSDAGSKALPLPDAGASR